MSDIKFGKYRQIYINNLQYSPQELESLIINLQNDIKSSSLTHYENIEKNYLNSKKNFTANCNLCGVIFHNRKRFKMHFITTLHQKKLGVPVIYMPIIEVMEDLLNRSLLWHDFKEIGYFQGRTCEPKIKEHQKYKETQAGENSKKSTDAAVESSEKLTHAVKAVNNRMEIEGCIKEDNRAIHSFTMAIKTAKKIIVVVGAGISESSGIPAFRNKSGRYTFQNPLSKLKGKQTMDALCVFGSEKYFHGYINQMAEIWELSKNAELSSVHVFIKQLNEENKLLRCYSQNIDTLEKRFLGDNKLTLLHGDLDSLICIKCRITVPFTQRLCEDFKNSRVAECQNCKKYSKQCERKGTLDAISSDAKNVDMLVVTGTSLSVPGIKHLVKHFCASVTAHAGKSFYINYSKPPSDIKFDFHISADANEV
ncbi:hypothetical protein HK099_000332, partial [Clydaea vesicula]